MILCPPRYQHAVAGVLASLLLAAAPARAQETRAAELEQQQAEKAKDLAPPVPGFAERMLTRVERNVQQPPTVYLFIGSVYRGGLMAAGPGLRVKYGDTGLLDVHAAWSLKNYKLVDSNLALPAMARGRIRADLHGSWIDAPSVSFYGIGNDSNVDTKVSYLYRPTTVGAAVRVNPLEVIVAGAGYDYLKVDTGPGARGPLIDLIFGDRLPGLNFDPTFGVTHVFAGVDWRQSAGYTQRGGLYRADWYDYRTREGGNYDFRRLDAEVNQFIPILRGNWVIALRGLMSTTTTDAGDTVPFFLLPDLGGSDELRGYSSWRFRDRHRILVGGEYRWTPGRFADMGLFFDAGKVTARRADLDLDKLRTSYGIGIRFHTPAATLLRVELAHTHEGNGLVFAFGPSF